MSPNDAELNREAAVYSAARKVQHAYRPYVETEDLTQIGWLWIAAHPTWMEEHPTMGYFRWLVSNMQGVMETYARKERAHALGYKPEDEVFYSRGIIYVLLPDALGVEAPREDDLEPWRGQKFTLDGKNWTAAVCDVKAAIRNGPLTAADRDILWYHAIGYTDEEIGQQHEITADALRQRRNRVVDKLVKHLGGARPRRLTPG